MKKAIKSNAKKVVVAGICAGLLASAGALAYFTASDTAQNNFHVNSAATAVVPKVVEENWVEDDAKNLAPMQTIAKDPKVDNQGTLDVYAQVIVKMPLFTGDVTDENGVDQPMTDVDLFTYEVNDGWTLSGEPTVEDGYRTYVYLYDSVIPSGSASTPLFDNVTLINLANTIEDIDDSIDVTVNAIQATGFQSASDAFKA